VCCSESFMDSAIAKAQAFYFEKYLPSVISCMIIKPNASDNLLTIFTGESCVIPSVVKPSSASPSTKPTLRQSSHLQ